MKQTLHHACGLAGTEAVWRFQQDVLDHAYQKQHAERPQGLEAQ